MTNQPQFTEKYLSQIPALRLLVGLGYEYLPPEETLRERGGNLNNVLLEEVLTAQLKKINRFKYKGQERAFAESNIAEAVHKLKNQGGGNEGLQKHNATIYDLITLGTALEETVDGGSRSFTLNYVDWQNIQNNVFHVTAEFSVARTRSDKTARPDIVLFVNGIPFCVMECKSPAVPAEQAVSQNIRNQGADYIPHLFAYTQLLLAINANAAKYGTIGERSNYWGVWDEMAFSESFIRQCVNAPLPLEQEDKIFTGEFAVAKKYFANFGEREVTAQDKALVSLCSPARLLLLTRCFTLFDNEVKKIARYQQFFTVQNILQRIDARLPDGRRGGGVVWHTQGSGKSLTMVMLAQSLALSEWVRGNMRLLLVTDRVDLDKQLEGTFTKCGLQVSRAESGEDLVEKIREKKDIITTLIHKFEDGELSRFVDKSADIIVLVDESHRTNFGALAANMRKMLPNACYIGFTGTPLLKKDKNSISVFGGLIKPNYPIRQAVADKAIVPLLYEGRHVQMSQDKKAMDLWFERYTRDLTDKQKVALKKKYARASMIGKAEPVITMRAFDIHEHFCKEWLGTGFKAQLVAPDKATAVRYRNFFLAMQKFNCEALISAPDNREGHEAVGAGADGEVQRFWRSMMELYDNEKNYNDQIIKGFRDGEDPKIIIVVDKLLTGFDAPKNTVLYLCRKLHEHTLLQAIARVNRLHENKEYGYIIDYEGVLGELDQTLNKYDALAGYDDEDITGTLESVYSQVKKLPQQHSHLWDVFKTVKNKQDLEQLERFLVDEQKRDEFYNLLTQYSKTLAIALSTHQFLTDTDPKIVKRYKADLKWFMGLRKSVKWRYGEDLDFREHEPRIKNLLDKHISANEVVQINKPVSLYPTTEEGGAATWTQNDQPLSKAAQADHIAHQLKKVIHEKMAEDPAFYAKFSALVQEAIDNFRHQTIDEEEYLETAKKYKQSVTNKTRDDVPAQIKDDDDACAYYGVINMQVSQHLGQAVAEVAENANDIMAEAAVQVDKIIRQHCHIVDFWLKTDRQHELKSQLDDYFYDSLLPSLSAPKDKSDVIIRSLIQGVMGVARRRLSHK